MEGKGPALMLVHGYPLSGELFARNRTALARHFRVVTPDLRGFGNSMAPDKDGSVQIYAKDMLAVMDHLNIKKAIIGGMSMGGPVVLEMYREAPQRFSGMILIDTTTSPANPVEQGEWPGFGKLAEDKGVGAMVPGLMPNMLTAATRKTQPALVATLGAIVKKGTVNAAVGGGKTLATRPDSRTTRIGVPVLILAGMDDPIYPMEMQMKMHQDIKGSSLTIIPGAAHAAIIEKAGQATAAILQWSRSHNLSER